MTSPSSQVFLKSTSSISLDERFTMMLQKHQAALTDIKDTAPQQLPASVKNQCLAQQMANWPSVLDALHSEWGVKQRQCKSSIKARLGRPMGMEGLLGMCRSCRRPLGSGVLVSGALSQRSFRNLAKNMDLIQPQHGSLRSRGELMQSRAPRRAIGGKGRDRLFIDYGSAERGAKSDSCPLPTREELDAQLDDYMSMTKSRLDAQLDAYMAEVDTKDSY